VVRRITAAAFTAMFAILAGANPAGAEPTQPGCGTGTTQYGAMTVCPAHGPVGTTVTLSGHGCHNPGSRTVTAVFLGPRAFIGSGGGGVQIDIPVTDDRFRTGFRIPSTYPAGGGANAAVPVTPGSNYRFGAYPADLCHVGFTVTAAGGRPPLAPTGPAVPVPLLVSIAITLLAAGVWLTKAGHARR
jgi:hypothetical protein